MNTTKLEDKPVWSEEELTQYKNEHPPTVVTLDIKPPYTLKKWIKAVRKHLSECESKG